MKSFISVKSALVSSLLLSLCVFSAAQTATSAKRGKSRPKHVQTKLYPVTSGMWGGQSMSFEVGANSVTIEFDCADGQIPRQLKADKKGNFRVEGTLTPRSMGPVRRDDPPKTVPALYEGKITGKTMTIKVTLTKTNESAGEFTIEQGKDPMLFRCQ